MLRRMFYRMPPSTLTAEIGEDIANCSYCVRYLNNSFALSFITHAVEHHKLDHDTATQVLDRVHQARWKGAK